MTSPHLNFAERVLADRAVVALRRDSLISVAGNGSAFVRFPADAIDRVDDLLWVATASEIAGSREVNLTVAVYSVQSLRLADHAPGRPVAGMVCRLDPTRDEVTAVTQSFVDDLYVDRIASLAPTRRNT